MLTKEKDESCFFVRGYWVEKEHSLTHWEDMNRKGNKLVKTRIRVDKGFRRILKLIVLKGYYVYMLIHKMFINTNKM